MSGYEPLTPVKVESGIRDAINRLDALTKEYATALDEQAKAEVKFKIAWATARTTFRHDNQGRRTNADMADDHATLACKEEERELIFAKAKFQTVKQALASTQTRIDAMRSLGANLRPIS